jgi:hypothetical protein
MTQLFMPPLLGFLAIYQGIFIYQYSIFHDKQRSTAKQSSQKSPGIILLVCDGAVMNSARELVGV